ncbi:catalase family protein [Acinetobacter sp. 25977_6]|nr:catalase family protein [Acinetobacter sp. 21871]EXR63693.1 catalase family protein [Acinetobacter sp. 1424608]EXT40272.1 catalase family protein [Acinetobacter sp. 25977_8]EXT45310.1 catalase family protein [Acinetobacter sp. 25977_7]EXT46451.1 catalase family protein [Acinetobacter sp. 25977_6]EXT51181.1 catalase family protein [Acinetobacter sp. 25977_4]EXT57467.1 catalase family protein [Acinetobacter sp. 25977_3]EXT60760.1 catalase family protein [Acinetobacter sp. 25977_2]EXT63758.
MNDKTKLTNKTSEMAGADAANKANTTQKTEQLDTVRDDATNEALTTNQGVKIADNQNSLRAGIRGSTLLEDFILREKITHFDHERIPERIVHARGVGAHGYFQAYEGNERLTKAGFLTDPTIQTPIFVRFSTVQGPRGSADTVRDIRGFAIKFYTQEGNFDLVGNNAPVFFVQDGIKFPDFVHAVKPEPDTEIPTGATAHDTFWDFVSLVPESAHAVIWAMSDRAIPRNLRSIQGFGVHTFRLINAEGKSHFVKFHWTPKQGLSALVWDEAQKLAGKDPDFHRRDLYEAIEQGFYPEWELGVQIVEEEDEMNFDFDLLDPTKIIPEELVPVTPIGRFVLNRNVDNFFAETEQVAFCPGHVVPGIDFTDDPLLQARLFSYTDTQLSRLGGPNFHQIPINKPVCPFHNNQRDGIHQHTIHKGQASYQPNSIDGNWPVETPPAASNGGFESYPEKISGHKLRQRSETFSDYFSQPRLYYKSLAPHEQKHVVDAYTFELSKVQRKHIRERQVQQILANIDLDLARQVGANLGIEVPDLTLDYKKTAIEKSAKLSFLAFPPEDIQGRKVAVLIHNLVKSDTLEAIKNWAIKEGVVVHLLAPSLAPVKDHKDNIIVADGMQMAEPSIAYDAVIVPDGDNLNAVMQDGVARHYVLEAYKHLKPIAFLGNKSDLLEPLGLVADEGTLVEDEFQHIAEKFKNLIKTHRVWSREQIAAHVPA